MRRFGLPTLAALSVLFFLSTWATASEDENHVTEGDNRPKQDPNPQVELPLKDPDAADAKKQDADKASSSKSEKDSFYLLPLAGIVTPFITGGTYFIFAGEIGWKSPIGNLGLFAGSSADTQTLNGILATSRTSAFMLSFTGQLSAFYFGVRAGIATRAVTATDGTAMYSFLGSAFTYASVLGGRIPITDYISANVEISLLTVESGNISGPLGTFAVDRSIYLVPMAGIHFAF